MTTHTWESNAKSDIYDTSAYTDGQAFVVGDSLVVSSGQPTIQGADGQFFVLTTGNYLFETGTTGGAFTTANVGLDAATILAQTGSALFTLVSHGQFVTNGIFDVGSTATSGNTQLDINANGNNNPSFVNNGQVLVQNASKLVLFANSLNSSVINSTGAAITVTDGSALAFRDYYGYVSSVQGYQFINNGLINISGTSGAGSHIDVESPYSGSGTLSITSVAGANPTSTYAVIDGPASGNFNLSSGYLHFDSGAPVQGDINFLDGNGLLDLDDNPVTQSDAVFKPLQATINHFQAGDKILLNGYVDAASYSYDPNSHILSLSSGGNVVAQLTFAGAYTTNDFQVSNFSSVDGVGANSLAPDVITTTSTANGTVSVTQGGTFNGGSASQVIDTQGNARVFTGGGANTVYLAAGNNLVVSHGLDTVVSSTGADTVFASGGTVAYGGGVGSRLEFIGQSGADTVSGGAGATTVFGAAGGGAYTAGTGGGSDLIATAGNTTLTGGANHDGMFGGSADGNVLQAGNQSGNGFDYLVAGSGATAMQNGNGNTVMYAGSGADLYGFAGANTGIDWVVGFKQGTDKIALNGISAADALRGAAFSSAGTVLTVGGSQVTVWNTHLIASDFD